MNGTAGLKGWQWLFVIDFIVSIPSIIYGFCFFPDFPHNTTCFWFSEEEKELAQSRLPNGHVYEVRWARLETWKRIFTSWQTYLFPVSVFPQSTEAPLLTTSRKQALFTLYGLGVQVSGNNVMPFFMEKHGDTTVVHLDYYPTGMTATGILAFWVYSILSDKIKSRVPASIAIGCTFIISSSLLFASAVPYGGKLFAFCKLPMALMSSWNRSDMCGRLSGYMLGAPGSVVRLGQCKLRLSEISCRTS